MKKEVKKYGKSFGKKEKVLNYASNTYQLTRPSKVGEVMALIRECQPKALEEWEQFYFEKAYTKTKEPVKITKEMLEECIQSPVLLSDSTQKVKDIPKAPGMKYKHYSPKGDAFILKGSHEQIISFFKQTPKEAALIACTNIVSKIDNRITFDLGYENDLETIAKYIFHALREMDRMNVPTIYIQSFPNKGLGVAIMNRLKKAANNKIITL